MSLHRRTWVCLVALVLLAPVMSACGSDPAPKSSSSASASNSAASASGSDVDAVKAALVAEFGKGKTPQAEAQCAASKVIGRLPVSDLKAMGVTDKGVDLATLGPKSLNLEPATVTFWDSVFECISTLSNLAPFNPAGDPAINDCLRRSVSTDKFIRLALVFGTPKGQQPPPQFVTLKTRFNDALQACHSSTAN